VVTVVDSYGIVVTTEMLSTTIARLQTSAIRYQVTDVCNMKVVPTFLPPCDQQPLPHY
jgi:hypothetical protein